MARFTKDPTNISHPSYPGLDKGSCPVKNRAGGPAGRKNKINSRPCRKKSTINPLSFGLSATFGPGVAI
ncbi:MAG: hypothetical protein WCC90_14450 [Methylocella sp.]